MWTACSTAYLSVWPVNPSLGLSIATMIFAFDTVLFFEAIVVPFAVAFVVDGVTNIAMTLH